MIKEKTKTISCLIAITAVISMLASTPSAMAGAYDTGEGHGYASCVSSVISHNGTIFRIAWIQPDARPALYDEIDLQYTLMFKRAFRPVACYLPGREI